MIAIPDICVIEALTATRAKINLSNRFEQEMDSRISDIGRSIVSAHAVSLRTHLEQARIENRNLINELERRLNAILERAAQPRSGKPRVMLLPLTPDALRESLEHDHLSGANDNLILSVILRHARTGDDEKVLLTGNTRDFGTAEAKSLLRAGGVTATFARTDAFLGWLTTR